MKTYSLALLIALALAGTVVAGEVREWTGARGLKVTGEFVELKDNKVVIKTDKGQLTEVPVMQLSVQDQMYARKQAVQLKTSGPAPAGEAAVLPHFKEGKWAGEYAVHEAPKMDVVISTNGFPTIYPKDNGKRVGPPIRPVWVISYSNGAKSRQIDHFIDPPPPAVIKERLHYKCLYEEKDKVETDFQFTGNSVELTSEFDEPSGVRLPGEFLIWIPIPVTHSFVDGTPRETIAKALTGYSLRFKESKQPEVVYDYYTHVTLNNAVVMVEIKGPWGARVLKIEQPRQGVLSIGNYPLTPLYAGYTMMKYVGAGSKWPPIRFTVE